MTSNSIQKSLGETIDRLMTLEIRASGFMNGVVPVLYNAVREGSDGPLAWTAARQLLERLADTDTAVILTGHVHPVVMPRGETDGPLGAAILARALNRGCNVHVIVLCDEQVLDLMQGLLHRTGVLVTHGLPQTGSPVMKPRVHLAAIPVEVPVAESFAAQLCSGREIGAAISVEKIAPNAAGVLHSGFGNDLTGELGRGDIIIEAIHDAGGLTIGIGDLGNEIGFGAISEVVREILPFGARCACPCGKGTASATTTDLLLPAGTSNWGAYALVAALCAQLGRHDLLHDSATEHGMLEVASAAGAVDGLSTGPTLEVDGIPGAAHGWWSDLLATAVKIGTAKMRNDRVDFEADGVIPVSAKG